MNVQFIRPRPELRRYIESLWLFESASGMPPDERSMAAPNGCPKLIIPYENSLESIANGRLQVSREHGLYFVGNRDTSTLIRSSARPTGFIGIEFAPHGAFAVFGLPMQETINRLLTSEDVFGRWGRHARETLCNLEDVASKVAFIQDELLTLLRRHAVDHRLVDFCVRALKRADGQLAIQSLERQTGFSRRYIDRLFNRSVGLSPKTLAVIYRFQRFYRKWAAGSDFDALKDELFDYYYDQSHFTREFKRMTGYSPQRYTVEVRNDFGRRITLR
jgi:AraC-like DNA-binding protein